METKGMGSSMKWTRHKVAKMLCAREGLKREVDIAQMKEIVRRLVELDAEMIVTGEDSPIDYLTREADDKVADLLQRRARAESKKKVVDCTKK